MHLPYLGTNIKITALLKYGSCIRNHSQTAISTASLWGNPQPSTWLIGFSKSVPLFLSSHPSLIRWTDKCGHHYGRPFANFRNLCTIFWQVALSLRHHHLPTSGGDELRWGGYVSPIKLNHTTKFLVGPSFRRYCDCTLSPEEHLSDSGAICCIRYLLPKNKISVEYKSYRLGNLTY
jgi:hypothetical protein